MRASVLSNECSVRTATYQPAVFGEIPWEQGYDAVKHIDFTKWKHDLFRHSGNFPYDPAEIEIIKKYNAMADNDPETAGVTANDYD